MMFYLHPHLGINSTPHLLGEFLLEPGHRWQFRRLLQEIFHIVCQEWNQEDDRGGH